nr:hypothetical protein CFP56_10375 [Quercus suber]
MASTPPPRSLRACTPPTPRHGPQHDHYEPYRRSTRSSAHSNPYSSFNSDRSPDAGARQDVTTPPPSTARKARFVRTPTQLSSPPSSPASPLHRRLSPRHTSKYTHIHNKRVAPPNTAFVDPRTGATLAAAPPADLATMLPTPSKTPKKRTRIAGTSAQRIVSFQPSSLNDVMPTPRKLKKHAAQSMRGGFELYDEDLNQDDSQIEIFTDANARVPVVDDAPDNPFVGRKHNGAISPRRSNRRGRAAIEEDANIEQSVRNDEGVTYVFRGKKIFRRFGDAEEANESSSGSELGQRSLKRKAGVTAQRPLTRSTVKPRLLFPSADQLQQRMLAADQADEEAVTDIEMPNAAPAESHHDVAAAAAAPSGDRFTPPPTNRSKRSSSKKTPMHATPIYEDSTTTDAMEATFPKKSANPFDAWPRTKSGRKRAGDAPGEGSGSGKRTRSGLLGSPVS